MPAPIPKIDDQYWFDASLEMVKGAGQRRDEAAQKLQNLVLWLWGIYTSITAVGFALAEKSLGRVPTLLIAAASVALVAVYWGTVWVQMPEPVTFDPRSPTEIARSHDENSRTKHRRLKITLSLSLVAALLVSLALIVASVAQAPPTPWFEGRADREGEILVVAVTARVGSEGPVDLWVLAPSDEELAHHRLLPLDGLIQTSIRVPTASGGPVQLVLAWDDAAGTRIRMARDLEEEPPSTGVDADSQGDDPQR